MFWKKSITEKNAANTFVEEVFSTGLDSWPKICVKLKSIDPSFQILGQNGAAAFEFVLALIAVQMRALNNLCATEQVGRIEQHIFLKLNNPPKNFIISSYMQDGTPKMTIDELGFFVDDERDPDADIADYPEQSIRLYRKVFDAALQEGDMLISGPAVLLGMKLGLITKQRQYRPEIVQPLFHFLTLFSDAFWKECVNKYRVIP